MFTCTAAVWGPATGHADLLHVDAGIAGEDVLIDSGRYTYVNTPLRRELKSPAAHNTTRVDDLDFSTCLDSWGYSALAIPVKGEHCFTDSADYVSGAHLGYLKQGLLPMRKPCGSRSAKKRALSFSAMPRSSAR